MNKDLWEFNERGKVDYDNDANDYFYEWTTVEADGMSLSDLVDKYLEYGEVRIKARKGAIFIVAKGDKDDTPNPEK